MAENKYGQYPQRCEHCGAVIWCRLPGAIINHRKRCAESTPHEREVWQRTQRWPKRSRSG